MNRKTDAQLRVEAERIMAASGLTNDDLFFDDCPSELLDECRRYEYVREKLRSNNDALKRAAKAVERLAKGVGSFSLADAGFDVADTLAATACRMLHEYPNHFPKRPFLNWWKSHTKKRQNAMLANLRDGWKKLRLGRGGKVPHGIVQRLPRKCLGDTDSKTSGRFETFAIAVNWHAVTSDNAAEVGRALLALKPKELRKPAGKRESPITPLNDLRSLRLLEHMTLDHAVAWLRGKPGLVSASRLEVQARRARKALEAR